MATLDRVPTHPTGRGWAHKRPPGAAAPARRPTAALLACAALLAAAACGGSDASETLVVITPFEGPVLAAVERAFEAAHPDVDVRFETHPDDRALGRLRDGDLGASVWWGADWHALAAAAAEGRLEGVEPSWSGALDGNARDPEGRWYGVHAAPLALAFNTAAVTRARAPRDWIDLAHLRWRGELVLPAPANEATRALVEQAMLEELRRTGVVTAGVDWLLRLDAAASGHAADEREQVRRLAAGEDLLTLLPAHRLAALMREEDWLAGRMMESGAPRIVRGVGVVAPPPGGPGSATDGGAAAEAGVVARSAALRFVDFLGTAEALGAVVEHTGLGPAVAGTGVDRDAGWPAVGSGFPVWTFSPDTLTRDADAWYARWERDIRGRGGVDLF